MTSAEDLQTAIANAATAAQSVIAELDTTHGTVEAKTAENLKLASELAEALDRIAELEGQEPEEPPVPTPTGDWGIRWPENTPPVTVPDAIVDCNWPAIKAAAAQHKGGVIAVRRGSLTGSGFQSGSSSVIAGLDCRGGRNTLIYPLEGYGSVKITKGINLREVHGVTFLGFEAYNQGVVFANCFASVWAWSELDHWRVTSHQSKKSSGIRWVEVVSDEVDISEEDRHRFITAGGGTELTDLEVWGFYWASIYRPIGSGAHNDGLQIEPQKSNGVPGGPIRNIRLRDGIGFGAANQNLMLAGIPDVTFENFVSVGGRFNEGRYPRPAGADLPEHTPVNLNGSAQVTLKGVNTAFGAVASGYSFSGTGVLNRPNWSQAQVDAWLDEHYPKPDRAALAAAWNRVLLA